MQRPLQNRLSFRLASSLGLAAALILVAAESWNLSFQQAQLTRLLVTFGSERADDIQRSIREAMMRNSPREVQRILDNIADQPGITRIRVFDKRGRIRTSTEASEIGSLVDKEAEQCVSCHGAGETLEQLQRPDRARIFSGSQGRILGIIAPIRNEPSCSTSSCHVSSQARSILGVLDLQLSLQEVDRALAVSERQMTLGLVGTVLAVLLASWLLSWRLVLKPVQRLTRAASEVAAGNLTIHIGITSSDEIGELTQAWNAMIAKLGRAQIVLERWSRTLELRIEQKTAELEATHGEMLQVEKMASLGKLSAVVAHEINNPLTGIGTYARLLRRRHSKEPPADRDQETDRILQLIEDEANRCGQIARDLLSFSRTPALQLTVTSLKPLLQRCLLLLRPRADGAGVELNLAVQEPLPEVECDAAQIQQMVMALGFNAVEATPAGGRVTIAALASSATPGIELLIRDTGRGIAEQDLPNIFEPFFTTKEGSRGVGLGLAVAYGIARRHRGSITVDSALGEGTTFTVRLLERQEAGARGEESSKELSG